MQYIIYCLLILSLLLANVVSQAFSEDRNKVDNVRTIWDAKSLGATGQATATLTDHFPIERADTFSVSWSVTTPVTPALTLSLRYANAPLDTHRLPTSVKGTTYSTTISITTSGGISDLVMFPCSDLQLQLVNGSASPSTATIRMLVK